MQSALEITSRQESPGVNVFVVAGRLDSRGTPQFVRECSAPLADGGITVVDLAGVTFLSSSGIGALLALSEQARDKGSEFRIASPARVVTSAIDLLNLGEYLSVFGSVAEATRRAA